MCFISPTWEVFPHLGLAKMAPSEPAILQTLSWRFSLSPPVFPVSVSLIRMESLCPKGYFVIVADAILCLSLKNQVTVSVSVNCREINSGTSRLIRPNQFPRAADNSVTNIRKGNNSLKSTPGKYDFCLSFVHTFIHSFLFSESG